MIGMGSCPSRRLEKGLANTSSMRSIGSTISTVGSTSRSGTSTSRRGTSWATSRSATYQSNSCLRRIAMLPHRRRCGATLLQMLRVALGLRGTSAVPTRPRPVVAMAPEFFSSASRRIVLSSERSATSCLSFRFSSRSSRSSWQDRRTATSTGSGSRPGAPAVFDKIARQSAGRTMVPTRLRHVPSFVACPGIWRQRRRHVDLDQTHRDVRLERLKRLRRDRAQVDVSTAVLRDGRSVRRSRRRLIP